MAVIYRHRKPNGEVFYVGIGTTEHRAYNRITRNSIWKNIVNKYDYEVEILRSDLTWQEACELEILLISEYGRLNNKTGILANMTDGGEGRYNSKPTIQTRKKMSESKIGKNLSTLTRNRMSDSSHLSKKVIDLSTGVIYKSATEVSKLFNMPQGTLRHYLIGSRTNKTTFKYI